MSQYLNRIALLASLQAVERTYRAERAREIREHYARVLPTDGILVTEYTAADFEHVVLAAE